MLNKLSIRISQKLFKRLKQKAMIEGRNYSEILRQLIKEYIEDEKKK